MKKVFVGLAIAAVFFFAGRNQSSVVRSDSKEKSAKAKSKHDTTADITANQSNGTASPGQQANGSQLGGASAQTGSPTAQQDTTPKTFNERLLTSVDTELFETLYSKEFKAQWLTSLPTLKQRLFSPLPKTGEPEVLTKEVAARAGILKALGHTQVENNETLKQFLFSYVDHAKTQSWVLQREAAHSLVANNDLSELEQLRITKSLDVRARNTASLTDREILTRSIEGDK